MRLNNPISTPLHQPPVRGGINEPRTQPQAEVVITPEQTPITDNPPQASIPALTRSELLELDNHARRPLTSHDQPTQTNLNAINSYQSIVNAPRREEIQSLVGIDVFV